MSGLGFSVNHFSKSRTKHPASPDSVTKSFKSLKITQTKPGKNGKTVSTMSTTTKLDFKYDLSGKLITGDHLRPEWRQETLVVAIDCEMVGVGVFCDSALARVSIVNQHGFCLYDTFVKPKEAVTDYRTSKSGVRPENLQNAPPHDQVVAKVASLLQDKIVVGHSVHHDFESLELDHPSTMTRDTASYYKKILEMKFTPSLQHLADELLHLKIQDGEHSSIQDAQVAMLLYICESHKMELFSREVRINGSDRGIRQMTIFPTKEDLDRESEFVRPIQVDKPYDRQGRYVNTMFRLLREDFMKPLREGVRQYFRWRDSRQPNDIPTTIRVYQGVRFCVGNKDCVVVTAGLRKIKMPLEQLTADLSSTSEDARYLLNGSLLLFVPNSKDIGMKLATVSRSRVSEIQQLRSKGLLNVQFANGGPCWTVDKNTNFTVLESVAFFEAYRYALASLQSLNMQIWPMKTYLLNPAFPIRTIVTNVSSFNFSSVIVTNQVGPAFARRDRKFPNASQLGFSQGQYEAFHSAVTKELTIIQGPPGTGKTFMAFKIIQFFLKNPTILKAKPILVVSNTNHSLDHLLEMVILYLRNTPGRRENHPDNLILRLGGQSKSNIVTEVSLFAKKQGYFEKQVAEAKLSKAREKLNAILALSSLKVDKQDLRRLTETLRGIQAFLDPPPSNLNTNFSLEQEIFAGLTAITGCVRSKICNLASQKLTNIQLNLLPFVVKSQQTKLELAQKNFEKVEHFLPLEQTIRAAKVIGVTVCGMVKQKAVLDKVKPAMVIVEEAAHVMEPTVVAGLTKFCRRLVLIGDHQQLRPSTADYELTVRNHLDVSMMERFVRTAEAHGRKTWTQLDVQRRMRPEISKLICPAIYSELWDHPSVQEFPDVKGMAKNLYFVEHDSNDAKAENSTSFVNLKEADFLFNLCLYLIEQGNKPEKITMIATYLGQKFELEKRLRQTTYYTQIRVCCVDGFQGEENDVILLSLVRSNDERNIGFLKTDNRVCVPLSRARHGLYIVGNMTGLTANSSTWAKINQTLVAGNSIGTQLTLKCTFHGTSTTVGMHGSQTAFEIYKNGKTFQCLCKFDSASASSTKPTSKPKSVSQPKPVQSGLDKQTLPFSPSEATVAMPHIEKKTSPDVGTKAVQSTATANNKPIEKQSKPTNKKFSCGHFCACVGKCKGSHASGYKCQEKCDRRCNGGHKCVGDHACFQLCSKIVQCKELVSDVCSKCSQTIKDKCSRLFPYYGKASKLYGTLQKNTCAKCK